jgi:hypothetical protein
MGPNFQWNFEFLQQPSLSDYQSSFSLEELVLTLFVFEFHLLVSNGSESSSRCNRKGGIDQLFHHVNTGRFLLLHLESGMLSSYFA